VKAGIACDEQTSKRKMKVQKKRALKEKLLKGCGFVKTS